MQLLVKRELPQELENEVTLTTRVAFENSRPGRPSRKQLKLARVLDNIIAKFEKKFKRDIIRVFNELGDEVERAVIDVLGELKSLRRYRAKVQYDLFDVTKDAVQDTMDSALIAESLDLAGIIAALEVVYQENYTSIMLATSEGIDAVIGLGFFTTEAEAAILASGGKAAITERIQLLNLKPGVLQRDIFAELAAGRAEGEAVAQLARRIRDKIEAGRFTSGTARQNVARRATLIARTETVHAQQAASAEIYKAGGVVEVMILDSRKGSFDAECDAVNGIIVSLSMGEGLINDEHPNGTRRMVAMPPPIEEGL